MTVLFRSIRILVLIVFCAVLSAQAADLEIEVRGIEVRTGQVHAALFANRSAMNPAGTTRIP